MKREKHFIEERQQRILKYISDNPSITYEEIAELTDSSRKTTERDIRQLKTSGMIERVGNTRASYWVIKT